MKIRSKGEKLPDGVLNWENSSFCWGAGGAADGKIDFAFGLVFPTGTGVAFFVTTARMLSYQNREINYISSRILKTTFKFTLFSISAKSPLSTPPMLLFILACSAGVNLNSLILTNEKCCSSNMYIYSVQFSLCCHHPLILQKTHNIWLCIPPQQGHKVPFVLGEYFFWGIYDQDHWRGPSLKGRHLGTNDPLFFAMQGFILVTFNSNPKVLARVTDSPSRF